MSSFLALLAKRLRLNGREWLTRAACAPWWTQRGWSMSLEEDVVLPTAHAQQNFAQQRDMVPMLGIDGDLRGGAERNLIGRHVVLDLDDSQRPAAFRAGAEIHERSRRRELASGDRIKHETDFALENAAGHGIESGLRLVAGLHPLKGILLECRRELLVALVGVNEDHDWPQRRGYNVHSRPQPDLGDEPGRRRPRHGLVEIPLRIGELGAEAGD